MEIKYGTENNYTLYGTSGDDQIYGYGGDDFLIGEDGNDFLDGGDSNDTLGGQDGNDTLIGGAGNDELYGSNGYDTLTGGTGDDVLMGGTFVVGEDGADIYVFSQGDGQDTIINYHTDNSADAVQFTNVASTAVGHISSSGSDVYGDIFISLGGTDGLRIVGGANSNSGIDQFQFSDGVTWTWSDIKFRSLLATSGDDILYGFNDEFNTILGLDGDDSLSGSNQNDTLDGGNGNDMLVGHEGSDTLNGGVGNDYLEGGGGDDILIGGIGNDGMGGDYGADTYVFTKGDGQDWINFRNNDNTPDVVKFTNLTSTEVEQIQLRFLNSEDLLISLGGTDSISIPSFRNYGAIADIAQFQFSDGIVWTWADITSKSLSGTTGTDWIYGFYGTPNAILGLGGNDYLYGGDQGDRLEGGGGSDNLHGQSGDDTLTGGTGYDVLAGWEGADTYVISKGDGQDQINNSDDDDNSSDVVKFTNLALTDLTSAVRSGEDLVLTYGTSDSLSVNRNFIGASYQINQFQFLDDDTLTNFVIGSSRQDMLVGTSGNDALSGLGNADSMSGGTGDDLYFVDNVRDLVKEVTNAGFDTVLSSINFILPDNVENLGLLVGAAVGTGKWP